LPRSGDQLSILESKHDFVTASQKRLALNEPGEPNQTFVMAHWRSTPFFPTTRRGLILVVLLTVGAWLLAVFDDSLGEPRRWILALMTVGLFFAPESRHRLRLPVWFTATGFVSLAGRFVQNQGTGPLLLLALWGAALLVRGGERASSYYLPQETAELDSSRRTSIRRSLQVSLALFVVVFLVDGYLRVGILADTRSIQFTRLVLLFASALGFIRFVVEQSRGTTLEPSSTGKLIGSQRWMVLILLGLLILTPLPHRLLARLGSESDRTLFLTSGFLMLLATVFFLASLLRLGRTQRWSRPTIRWASFVAGVFLAHTLFAYMVDLGYRIDPVGGGALTPRAVQGIKTVHLLMVSLFLVVLPFVHDKTRLLRRYSKPSFFVAPPGLAVMSSPLVAVNGDRWHLASTGFLYFVAIIIVFLYTLEAAKKKRGETAYFISILMMLLWGGYLDAFDKDPVSAVIKLFVVSLCFVLYGLDLYNRAGLPTRENT
jgi:hypothetical protein